MVENLYELASVQLLHAAQAVDLRERLRPDFHLGRKTSALHAAYRDLVRFVEKDRILTPDLANEKRFLRPGRVFESCYVGQRITGMALTLDLLPAPGNQMAVISSSQNLLPPRGETPYT